MAGSHAGRVAAAAAIWSKMLGVSGGFKAMIKDGLLDLPTQPRRDLLPMGTVPQSEEDLASGN